MTSSHALPALTMPSRLRPPRIERVCRCALARTKAFAGAPALEPHVPRRSDAKIPMRTLSAAAGSRVVLRLDEGDTLRIDRDRGRASTVSVMHLKPTQAPAVARQREAVQAEIEVLLDVAGFRTGMPKWASACSLWCAMVEDAPHGRRRRTPEPRHAAPCPKRLACFNASPERSTPGPLPYQMREHALVLARPAAPRPAGAPDRGRREVLVDAGLEMDVVRLEEFVAPATARGRRRREASRDNREMKPPVLRPAACRALSASSAGALASAARSHRPGPPPPRICRQVRPSSFNRFAVVHSRGTRRRLDPTLFLRIVGYNTFYRDYCLPARLRRSLPHQSPGFRRRRRGRQYRIQRRGSPAKRLPFTALRAHSLGLRAPTPVFTAPRLFPSTPVQPIAKESRRRIGVTAFSDLDLGAE